MPLPEIARAIVSDYLAKARTNVTSRDPLFVVRYQTRAGNWRESRITGQRTRCKPKLRRVVTQIEADHLGSPQAATGHECDDRSLNAGTHTLTAKLRFS